MIKFLEGLFQTDSCIPIKNNNALSQELIFIGLVVAFIILRLI
jgi:hypothetical protein